MTQTSTNRKNDKKMKESSEMKSLLCSYLDHTSRLNFIDFIVGLLKISIVCSTKNSLAASYDKSELCLSTRCEMNY
jgi:hypothetical protein